MPQGCTKDKLVDDFKCEELVTFDDVRSIIRSKCGEGSTCHNPSSGQKPIYSTTYEAMETSLTDDAFEFRVFVLNDMPPTDPQLDSLERVLLRCWVEGGYLKE